MALVSSLQSGIVKYGPVVFMTNLFQMVCFKFRSPAIIVSVFKLSRESRSQVRNRVIGFLYTETSLCSEFLRLLCTAVLVRSQVNVVVERCFERENCSIFSD